MANTEDMKALMKAIMAVYPRQKFGEGKEEIQAVLDVYRERLAGYHIAALKNALELHIKAKDQASQFIPSVPRLLYFLSEDDTEERYAARYLQDLINVLASANQQIVRLKKRYYHDGVFEPGEWQAIASECRQAGHEFTADAIEIHMAAIQAMEDSREAVG